MVPFFRIIFSLLGNAVSVANLTNRIFFVLINFNNLLFKVRQYLTKNLHTHKDEKYKTKSNKNRLIKFNNTCPDENIILL